MTATKRCDVLVVGSDVAALAAAVDCARIGLSVIVWIPQKATFSNKPALFTHRAGIVAGFLDMWNVPYRILKPDQGEQSICGIPGNPFSKKVVKTLGWAGAWRVYLDRIKPILTIGNEQNLAILVTSRMGSTAVNKLVNPATKKLYGTTADKLLIDDVAPGLAQAMTRGGSLSGGVLEQFVSDERVCELVVVDEGHEAIANALLAQLVYFAATVTRVENPTKKLETFYKKASVFLLDFSDVQVPEGIDPQTVFEVGISSEKPGLEKAIPASLHSAVSARKQLLSDPEKPPIGLGGV